MLGRLTRLLSILALLSSITALVVPAPALAAAACSGVQVVWARGTGDPASGDTAGNVFVDTQMQDRITAAGTTFSEYRLGSGTGFGGFKYPATGTRFDFLVGGYLHLGGPYADSVAQGRHELAAYLADRAATCPNERYVLGGWSQGAQVIGEGLFDVSASIRARIAFVALFGDPKRDTGFYPPVMLSGGQVVYPVPYPPACEGNPRPWIRGTADCASWAASLARAPIPMYPQT